MTTLNQTVKRLSMPMTEEDVRGLNAGERILLSGYIYTGRDAAHKKMIEGLNRGEELPFDMEGQAIYYVGPTPTKPGDVIGSAGPTTSGRMDAMTVPLLEKGLRVMIGKGLRNDVVVEGMKKHGAVYLAASGGAGALLSSVVKSVEIVAYEELGTEAIRKLYVEDMPLIVVIDAQGNDLYQTEPLKYKK